MRICIVYICAYIVLVCIGIYIHAYVHFLCGCNIEARRAFVPCIPCSRFSSLQPLRSLLPPGSILWPFAPPYLYRRPRVPFAVPFALKRLQRSFYSVFRAVLSDPNFRRVLLYLLHRSSLSHGSKHGKNAVIRGRGAPWGAGRAARLTLRTIFYFLFPKIFFLENPLSPSASCPFQCQNPVFLVPLRVCVPKKPRRSPNLLKETPF